MNIKVLTLEQITAIYGEHMPEAFPKAEIRPLSNIESLFHRGNYLGLGGYDESELKVYGLYVTTGRTCMLDYLAVLKDGRGTGIGSEYLKSAEDFLKDFDLVLLEVEQIEAAKDAAEEDIRRRRIAFYERNGCRISGIKSTVFDVDYNVLYNAGSVVEDDAIEAAVTGLYHTIFPNKIFNEKVKIYR